MQTNGVELAITPPQPSANGALRIWTSAISQGIQTVATFLSLLETLDFQAADASYMARSDRFAVFALRRLAAPCRRRGHCQNTPYVTKRTAGRRGADCCELIMAPMEAYASQQSYLQ